MFNTQSGMRTVYGADSSEIQSQFDKALCRTAPQSKSAQVVLSQIDGENYCWRGQRVLPFHHSNTWCITHAGDFNSALLTKGRRRRRALECQDGFFRFYATDVDAPPELMLEVGSATGGWGKSRCWRWAGILFACGLCAREETLRFLRRRRFTSSRSHSHFCLK